MSRSLRMAVSRKPDTSSTGICSSARAAAKVSAFCPVRSKYKWTIRCNTASLALTSAFWLMTTEPRKGGS
ncbi:hypothetical protein D3C81_1642700 [compost metagenome]